MKKHLLLSVLLFSIFLGACRNVEEFAPNSITLEFKELKPVAQVDERYQSYNVEMCEVVGGDFWIPYHLLDTTKLRTEGFAALKRTIPPINLYEPKIRTLASALGPVYMRVSGTWANTTYFQDNDEAKLSNAPEGYENVLTRKEWKGVIDFCKAVDAKLVTSFAISDGIRDQEGNWTPAQAGPFLDYTRSIGGEIVAAELFNEPSHASYGGAPEGYDASWFARDFESFRSFMDSVAPEMKLMGPGSTGEGGILPGGSAMSTEKIFSALPKPEFEIFSYHYYGGVSQRCQGTLTPENALSSDWLSKTELGLRYYEESRDSYLPGAPIWLSETAEAACGGNPWAATYLDCFRYLEQLGRLAKKGVQVVMHNTLAASEYALLDQQTLEPRPNYWAAVLWNRLMGTEVYDAGIPREGVDIFVHKLKNSTSGMAVLLVNPNDTAYSVHVPSKAELYLLTADDLQAKELRLNGKILALTEDEQLPEIEGSRVKAGDIKLPPFSILFISFQ